MGTHGQVRVVIAMTTGREKIEQDVLVFFSEEGREAAERGRGVIRDRGNGWGFRDF